MVGDSGNSAVYRTSGGTPFGGDDAGNIPPDAPTGPMTKCANGVVKAVGKLSVALIKCHIARATEKLADDTAEDGCEMGAKDKFATTKTAGDHAPGSRFPGAFHRLADALRIPFASSAMRARATRRGGLRAAGSPAVRRPGRQVAG